VRRAAVPEGRQLRLARQDGQVHLLRRRPRGRRVQGGVREVRRQPAGRRQAAAVRRDVLDQVAARRRRRHHRAGLQGAGGQARLRLGRRGLEDGLQRDDRVLIGAIASRTERQKKPQGGAGMSTLLRTFRLLIAMIALCGLALVTVPVNPAAAQRQVNPTADAVKEDQLLNQRGIISGRGTIPDVRSWNLEQPRGRDWREFQEVTLPFIGAIAILGMLAILVLFYLIRGMVRLESGRSGRVIVRFNAFERFVHWMTATCFIILAITGLNITFGRKLLLPLVSPDTFTTWSQWAKYVHNFLSFPFTL